VDETNKHEAFKAHLERARVIVSQWPAWKREILGNKHREPEMETNLTQEYLDRITRSCGGTVAKPATVNVRSDAASANEAATAVAGAGPGVPAWKAACCVEQAADGGYNVLSPTRSHWWTRNQELWNAYSGPSCPARSIGAISTSSRAHVALNLCATCPPDWPTAAHADDPREEPERFCEATGPMPYEVTYPDGRTEKLDKLPRTEMPQAFTTTKPKPCESIERLIDRLAKVNGAIEVSHGMAFRVTGQVEKAEPRTHDEPGYPEHFALHHVYLPEDWTRGILTAISYDLASKLDKGTVRTVLESVSRALLLTGEMDEADLLGLAVAVEDKLDIGK
jgi:hypothetical protein